MLKYLMGVVGLFGLASAFGLMKWQKYHQGLPVVPGEVIVKLKDNKALMDLNLAGVQVERTIQLSYGLRFVLKLSGNKSFDHHLNDLKQSGLFEYVEPNYIWSIVRDDLSQDPKSKLLWGLENDGGNEPTRFGQVNQTPGKKGVDISAKKAWDISEGDREVKIAVIDTGIEMTHEDLKENMWTNQAELNGEPGVDDDGNGFIDDIYGYDFANNDGDPIDDHGHGTHCAGTIGAVHDNQLGVAGVMKHVSLMALKFLDAKGSGTTENAIKAIDYATQMGVDIMNNSWGGGGFSQALLESIERANEAGIYFVAASGNSFMNNDTYPHYPSNYQTENVFSVGAHDAQERLAFFSNFGAKTVHVIAPGHNILSTVKGNSYEVYSGTSMATPHVSGILGLYVAKNGRAPSSQVKEQLMLSSVPVASLRRKSVSQGRVDAYQFLAEIYPPRSEPKPEEWKRYSLANAFESEHPYGNNSDKEYLVKHPGAQFIRLVIKKYQIENGFDYLSILDPKNNDEYERISGSGEEFITEYIEGDSLKLKFSSDYLNNAWGYQVLEYEAIEKSVGP